MFDRKEDLETQESHLNRKQRCSWSWCLSFQSTDTCHVIVWSQPHLIYATMDHLPHVTFSTSLPNSYVFWVSHVAQASLRRGDPSASAVLGLEVWDFRPNKLVFRQGLCVCGLKFHSPASIFVLWAIPAIRNSTSEGRNSQRDNAVFILIKEALLIYILC